MDKLWRVLNVLFILNGAVSLGLFLGYGNMTFLFVFAWTVIDVVTEYHEYARMWKLTGEQNA